MANPPKKILVIQLKMIGDVLISSIICNNIKSNFPSAQVDYLVYPFTVPVLANNPNIDTIIAFPEKARTSKIELFKFIFELRRAKYDIVIDAYSKLESCLITMFSGADRKIGFEGKGVPFSYNEKVPYPMQPESFRGLAIERREKLIEAVVPGALDPYPKLFLTQKELEDANVLLEKHAINAQLDKLVMISILGSEPTKTYPIACMAKLIDRIAAEPDVKILFNYIPKQLAEATAVFEQCSAETRRKIVIDLIGTDLRSFMAIMSYCRFIVGNDGGAINIAKALNKPSFTIFSPWIEKISWSIFEDGITHKAVHLNDYQPEVISGKSRKELQKYNEKYYRLLTPECIMADFEPFLQNHLQSSK